METFIKHGGEKSPLHKSFVLFWFGFLSLRWCYPWLASAYLKYLWYKGQLTKEGGSYKGIADMSFFLRKRPVS